MMGVEGRIGKAGLEEGGMSHMTKKDSYLMMNLGVWMDREDVEG